MMEGELKRIKSFFSSSKDIYRLNGTLLEIKKLTKGVLEYKTKFDLSFYTVRLSRDKKDTFYLEPNPQGKDLALGKVEFRCQSAEIRARWFLAISKQNQVFQA